MTAGDIPSRPARSWPLHGGEPPCLWLTWDGVGPVAAGDSACQLGARYQVADGRARGVFAEWSWDGETLAAEVDPLGFFSLFVYVKDGTIGVSPSLLALVAAGADTTPDHRALAVFYHLGLFVNDDTPLRHVRVLPPGGRLRWSRGKLEIAGGPVVPRELQISRTAAVDGFNEHLRQSLGRILQAWPGEFLLPLSGGRDSRHILLEMRRLGRHPAAALTFQSGGERLNAEAQAARAICQHTGIPHVLLRDSRRRSRDTLRTLVLTGLCADEHAQMMPLHDYLAGRSAAVLDGIAGDILSNPDDWAEGFKRLSDRGDFHGIARGMIEGHGKVISTPSWKRGAGPIYAEGREEEAVAYLGETIARFAEAPDPYQAFWFWNRTRREIGFTATAVFASGGPVFCPYLDPDLVDFGLGLPWAVTRDQQLHNDAIALAYPDCRDVPFQEGFAEPSPRRAPVQRIRTALDGIATLLALRPDSAMDEIVGYLKGSPRLHRGAAETYRLHALSLESLDSAKARRLLAITATTPAARLDTPTSTSLPEAARAA